MRVPASDLEPTILFIRAVTLVSIVADLAFGERHQREDDRRKRVSFHHESPGAPPDDPIVGDGATCAAKILSGLAETLRTASRVGRPAPALLSGR